MATITEDYVSFETAKLLKDKGFDAKCRQYYIQTGERFEVDTRFHTVLTTQELLNIQIVGEKEERCVAPTLQTAMKWLREVHNLCIEPYRTACGYLYTISTIPYGSCKCNPKEGGDDEDSGQWTTYEGACEAAIKYCLENLI